MSDNNMFSKTVVLDESPLTLNERIAIDRFNANTIILDEKPLTLNDIIAVARFNARIEFADHAFEKLDAARVCVENHLGSNNAIYGINTGFGALANIKIPADKLDELQLNLIRSHACGVGDPLPEDVVRAVLLLRIKNILQGHSGSRREPVLAMQSFLNHDITPYVPAKGSVGASGDLAPLAHIALNLIGEGRVFYQGNLMTAIDVFEQLNLTPLSPKAKEGISLMNGTQVMTAIGMLCCYDAKNLLKTADITAAISLVAIKGTLTAFRPEIQAVRPHAGQATSARNITAMLADDEILQNQKYEKVQDSYSFRCVPQVHGAARNAFTHVFETLLCEANSSTDNPLVFVETDEILSGGNFHGEPVALVLDYLAIALSEIGNISERRLEKLVNPHMSGLPPFLTNHSGLQSGFMIPQYVAAALVNECKVLSTPASVDSIPTSAEKEDHVSMGMTSANKLRTIIKNVAHILSLELLAGVEGVEFHLPLQGGVSVRECVNWVRKFAAPVKEQDRSLAEEIEIAAQKIIRGELVECVNNVLGGYELR